MNTLEEIRKYLAKLYDSALEQRLIEDLRDNSMNPLWIRENESAWLLDRELGIALRLEPFAEETADLNIPIQDVIKRLALLQPRPKLSDANADNLGMWQLAIVWVVVRPELADAWRSAMTIVRRQSGLSEEIGLDALIATNDMTAACDGYGFPQLLIATRNVLRMNADQMPSWLSANSRVRDMLEAFPDQFAGETETRKLALNLVNDALAEHDITSNAAMNLSPTAQDPIESIEIRDFRNIRHIKAEFHRDPGRTAQTHVVFGPNGAGKTSLFEAICLASGGMSRGWDRYLRDQDVEAKQRDYLGKVIGPLGSARSPRIFINGRESTIGGVEDPREQWRTMEGTFLAQEDSREFLGLDGSGLGEKILKGYSTLVDKVTTLASDRENAARQEKSNWLREHGLSAAITRRETRAQKLIEDEISRRSFSAPAPLLEWLQKTSLALSIPDASGTRIFNRWKAWSEQRGKIVTAMVKGVLGFDSLKVKSPLRDWLDVRNSIIAEAADLVARARPEIESLRVRFEGIEGELEAFREWLTRQAGNTSEVSEQDHASLSSELALIREALREARDKGDLVRRHETHLRELSDGFLATWAQAEPDTCPTCGDDHSQRGGIEHAVRIIRDRVDRELTSLEEQERALSVRIGIAERRLTSLGLPPISQARQSELQEMLSPFVGTASLITYLSNIDSWNELKRQMREIRVLPDVPSPLANDHLEDLTRSVAERAMTLDREAERLWPLPEQWKAISTALKGECDRIVAGHLPATLQRLWWEIAGALTAARWNLAFRAEFLVRPMGKLVVGTHGRPETPARYLYNQAEQHVLGLAWFVVRYLTFGRFRSQIFALDDPAQEMDQTTFRTFVRFLQAFQRLHESRRAPLQVLIFLHQEDRALDVARATLGGILMLGWRKALSEESPGGTWRLRLIADGFSVRTASSLFTAKDQQEAPS